MASEIFLRLPKRSTVGMLSLPNELLLRIQETLADDLLSFLCLALSCKRLWSLINVCAPDGNRTIIWEREIHLPGVFAKRKELPDRKLHVFNSPFWTLLRRLEDSRWRCCSGCLRLHPVHEFPEAQLEVDAEHRTCDFGPLVGVVDLCPCFRLTARMKARLVKALEVDFEESRVKTDFNEDEDRVVTFLHKCRAKRSLGASDRAEDRETGDSDDANTAAQDGAFDHESHFGFDRPGVSPEFECHGCQCNNGQSVRRSFSACLDNDGNFYIESEISVGSDCYEPEYKYGWPSLYDQLATYPVFICPHRSLLQLILDLYSVWDSSLYDRHALEHPPNSEEKPFLVCEFCRTLVLECSSRSQWDICAAWTFHVRTMRILGKAKETVDEDWHAQTAFSQERAGNDEERKRQSPWRTWDPNA